MAHVGDAQQAAVDFEKVSDLIEANASLLCFFFDYLVFPPLFFIYIAFRQEREARQKRRKEKEA